MGNEYGTVTGTEKMLNALSNFSAQTRDNKRNLQVFKAKLDDIVITIDTGLLLLKSGADKILNKEKYQKKALKEWIANQDFQQYANNFKYLTFNMLLNLNDNELNNKFHIQDELLRENILESRHELDSYSNDSIEALAKQDVVNGLQIIENEIIPWLKFSRKFKYYVQQITQNRTEYQPEKLLTNIT